MATLKSISAGNIISPSGRGNLAIAEMLTESKLLLAFEKLSAFQLDQFNNKFTPYVESMTVQNRDVNGALTTDTYSPADEVTATQKIIGGKLTYDAVYQRDAKRGLGNFNFEQDLKMKFRTWVRGMEGQILTGTGAGTPAQLKGIATIVNGTDNIPGYAETRVLNANTFSVTDGAKSFAIDPGASSGVESVERALLMLNTGIGLVKDPNLVVMRQELWAKYQALGFGKSVIGYTDNNFGFGFNTLFGIPVVTVSGGLTLTEGDDATTPATNTTSIIIGSFGENKTSWITQGFSWWDFDAVENKEAGVEKWEFTGNWRITDPKSILRIRNIKA